MSWGLQHYIGRYRLCARGRNTVVSGPGSLRSALRRGVASGGGPRRVASGRVGARRRVGARAARPRPRRSRARASCPTRRRAAIS